MPTLLERLVACAIAIVSLHFVAPSLTHLRADEPSTEELQRDFKIQTERPLKGRLAFTATLNSREVILVADLASHRIHKVITGPGNNSAPSFSPDGSKLAFTSDRDGNRDIYLADFDGGHVKKLTPNLADDEHPSWAPDGKRVVYYAEPDPAHKDGATNLFIVDTESGEISQATHFREGRNTTPRFTPDGHGIAYSTNRFWPGWDVCIFDLKARLERCPVQGSESYGRPSFSKSGKQIVVSAGSGEEINLALFNLDRGSTTGLTSVPRREYDAVFSPDDRYIAFAGESEPNHFELYLYDFDQKRVLPLVQSRHSMRFLSWSEASTLELEARRMKEQ